MANTLIETAIRFKTTGIGSVTSSLAALQAQNAAVAGGLAQTDRQVAQLDQTFGAMQASLAGLAVATAVAGGALYKMARQGAEVDMLFAEMQATSGATAEQMARVRAQANELGAILPTTLTEAADAFREMSYAGYDAEEAIAASTGVVYLAETGSLDMANAARIATSALNAFRMEASKANAVANTLAGAFATSAVTVGEISHSLEYASAAAFQAGQSLTEVTAAIGALGDVGLRASKAGVGLQQMFNRLADPTQKAQDALAELNLEQQDFIDESGNFRDLYDILQIISEAFNDVDFGKADQLRILTSIFQTRGARAVAPLVNNVDLLNEKIEQVGAASIAGAIADFESLTKTARELRETEIAATLEEAGATDLSLEIGPNISTEDYINQLEEFREVLNKQQLTQLIVGSLQVDERAAEILAGDIINQAPTENLVHGLNQATTAAEITAARMRTVGGQVEYLLGSLSAFAYVAYRQIEPFFKTLGNGLIWVVDLMNSNQAVAQVFGMALLGLAAALATATAGVGVLTAGMWASRAAANQNIAAMAALQVYQYAAATSSRVLTGAVWLMTASFADLRKAISAGIARLAAWRAAAAASSVASLGLVGALKAAAVAARGFLVALGPIGWAVLAISAAWLAWESGLLDFLGLGDEAAAVVEGLGNSLAWLVDLIGFLGAYLGYLVGFGIDALFGSIASAAGGLVSAFDPLIGALQGVVDWYENLTGIGKVVVGAFLHPLLAIWYLEDALSQIPAAIAAAGGALGWLGGLLGRFGSWLGGVLDPFEDYIEKLRLGERVTHAAAVPLGILGSALSSLHGILVGVADGITVFFEWLDRLLFADGAAESVGFLASALGLLYSVLTGGLVGAFETVVGGIVTTLQSIGDRILGALQWVLQGGFLQYIDFGVFSSIGEVLVGALVAGIRAYLGALTAVFGVLGGIFDWFTSGGIFQYIDWGMLASIGGAIIESLTNSVMAGYRLLYEAISGLGDIAIEALQWMFRGGLLQYIDWDALAGVGEYVIGAIIAGVRAYLGVLSTAFDLVGGVFDWFTRGGLLQYIDWGVLAGIGGKIVGAVVGGVRAYIGAVTAVFGILGDVLAWYSRGALLQYIDWDALAGVGESILAYLGEAVEDSIDIVYDAFSALEGIAGEVMGWMFRGGLLQYLPLQQFYDLGVEMVNRIIDGFGGLLARLGTWFRRGGLLQYIDLQQFYHLGRRMIDQIIEGIKDAPGAIAGAIQDRIPDLGGLDLSPDFGQGVDPSGIGPAGGAPVAAAPVGAGTGRRRPTLLGSLGGLASDIGGGLGSLSGPLPAMLGNRGGGPEKRVTQANVQQTNNIEIDGAQDPELVAEKVEDRVDPTRQVERSLERGRRNNR